MGNNDLISPAHRFLLRRKWQGIFYKDQNQKCYKIQRDKRTLFCPCSEDKMNTCFMGFWASARSSRSGIWANNVGGAANGELGEAPSEQALPRSQVNWDKAEFMQEPNHSMGSRWGIALKAWGHSHSSPNSRNPPHATSPSPQEKARIPDS